MRLWPAISICGALTLATSVQALTLEMPPGTIETLTESTPSTSARFPLTAYADRGMMMREAEGHEIINIWKVPSSTLSTLQMITPLKEQLEAQGFQVLLECESVECGGFDFRYRVELKPEPEMHVDLGDYRFTTLRRVENGVLPEYVSLMVSRSANNGFVQMNRIGPALPDEEEVVASTRSAPSLPSEKSVTLQPVPLVQMLEEEGHAILSGLSFDTGSAELNVDETSELDSLAVYLKNNPDRRVALVGHTDAEGSLDGNMALSKKRAQSVQDYLVSEFGVDPAQLESAGVGYLAPLTTNLSDEGRTQNRRVEAILTSTQ